MTGLLLFSKVHFDCRIISMQIEKDSQKPKPIMITNNLFEEPFKTPFLWCISSYFLL